MQNLPKKLIAWRALGSCPSDVERVQITAELQSDSTRSNDIQEILLIRN